ncbi:hypothetical protein [Bythopirellula polymerisocia]|uniref:PEP-CTERM protein-sorting domain-containing protein n=1 Tax=Bythopirellula polymerisocia TaxID=2528003 RepID=A0A5C6CT76_9BACT|nr:hypothetical protein [Bythopirellula polymerisocia]TWU27588.1 hypothetical protein Pla144_23650 [Bythopirellula polymerisocia]
MILQRCVFAGFMVILSFSLASAGTVNFRFDNGSAFDNVSSGVSMTADNTGTGGTDTITMTSVDILAPEYADDPLNPGTFIPTGNTWSAAGGDNVTTNIDSGNNALAINNGSVNNTQYGTTGGSTDASGEAANFNFDEAWTIEFDQPVILSFFNFSSMSNDDVFEVTVEGVGTFNFPDNGSSDDYADPLSGLVIPTGNNVTFKATGSLGNVGIRITEIQVDTIPEPASFGLLAAMLLSGCLFRPRHGVA